MNMNQRFDDDMKDLFRNYTPQVHPRIWENIITKREKRRPAGFWITFLNSRNILLFSTILLATTGGSYLLLKTPSSKKEQISTVKSTLKPVTENLSEPVQNQVTTINKEEYLTPTATSSFNDVDNKQTEQVTTGEKIISTTTGFKIKVTTPTAQNQDETISVAIYKKKYNNVNTDTQFNDTENWLINNNQNSQAFTLNKLFFTNPEKIKTETTPLPVQKRVLQNVFLPDCPSIEKNAAGNKTYIEVYAGPDIAFRSLVDTGNSAYLQKRKESTTFSSAYSAGFRYTKVFNNGMSIRTGINYSQITEKFTFVQGNLVQITYIINANGDTTGSYITTGTRYKTTYNKYRSIDVPVLIGYELGNGKFHANFNAGLIINAYSWQKGEVLDTSYNPVSITTGKTNSPYQFKTNIGVGFMAGMSVYYKLNDKLHLLAEPYFRYNLTPMTKEKFTLKQKYNTAGLRLGVRLDLQ